jgi:glycosyltransferase involved in cell wall biosynthesis
MTKNPDSPTIGVVAISYNEETDLPGFLDHLLPWVDEIVLVDDGSADRTEEIAVAAGEKIRFVLSPRNPGEYYADQRNKGIAAAASDWLLHMDVDERVPPDLADEIRRAIAEPGCDAYRFRRLNYFLNRPMRGGGFADWNLVHLARKDCLRFSGMYHEEIHLSCPDDRVGQLNARIHHLNDDGYDERLQKSAGYQFEIANRIRSSGKRLRSKDIYLSFLAEFFYKYVWKRGFVDGTPGLIWAFHSAAAAVRARALVWDEQNRIPREKIEEGNRNRWQDRPERLDG